MHPPFSLHILILAPHSSPLLRDYNLNTSFYKHVLCLLMILRLAFQSSADELQEH